MIPVQAKPLGEMSIHPRPGPWVKNWSAADVNILCQTIYAEAKGQAYAVKLAIGFVACNIVMSTKPRISIAVACQENDVFPCWRKARVRPMNIRLEDPECLKSARAAIDVLLRLVADPTGGATRFHPENRIPNWATSLTPTARFGKRWFYTESS